MSLAIGIVSGSTLVTVRDLNMRGHIIIETAKRKPLLYLYTHEYGENLRSIVHKTLQICPSRWADHPYMNRMMFQTMLREDKNPCDYLGFGISAEPVDIHAAKVYVCYEIQTVRCGETKLTFSQIVPSVQQPLPQA